MHGPLVAAFYRCREEAVNVAGAVTGVAPMPGVKITAIEVAVVLVLVALDLMVLMGPVMQAVRVSAFWLVGIEPDHRAARAAACRAHAQAT